YLRAGIAPEFPEENAIEIPGDATALADLGDKVAVFTREQVYVIFGEGPNDLGQQDSFSRPQSLLSDVGCVQRASVVQGPWGVLFQSSRALELLGRDMQVRPRVSAPVEDDLGGASITSAVLVPDRSEVRFTASGIDSLLVWNYEFGTWSTWTDHDDAFGACMLDGVYEWLQGPTGAVHPETSGYIDTLDGSTDRVQLDVTTGWLNLA